MFLNVGLIVFAIAQPSPAGFCELFGGARNAQDEVWIVDEDVAGKLPAGVLHEDAVRSLDAALALYARASRAQFRHRVIDASNRSCETGKSCMQFLTNEESSFCSGFERGACVFGFLCGAFEDCIAGMCERRCENDSECPGDDEFCDADGSGFCEPRTRNGQGGVNPLGDSAFLTVCSDNILGSDQARWMTIRSSSSTSSGTPSEFITQTLRTATATAMACATAATVRTSRGAPAEDATAKLFAVLVPALQVRRRCVVTAGASGRHTTEDRIPSRPESSTAPTSVVARAR